MKKLLIILLLASALIGITGCKNGSKAADTTELESVNNKIVEFFSSSHSNDKLSDNFCFNYIDEKNQIVVVGLLNNSEEQQKEFREKVIDSKLIKFVQGSKNINLPKNQ